MPKNLNGVKKYQKNFGDKSRKYKINLIKMMPNLPCNKHKTSLHFRQYKYIYDQQMDK